MSGNPGAVKPRYDWKACAVAVVVGLAVAIPAGLAVASVINSTLLLTAVVTVVGPSVSRLIYARLAKPGARPIDDESCAP
jgi:hypothetical protein